MVHLIPSPEMAKLPDLALTLQHKQKKETLTFIHTLHRFRKLSVIGSARRLCDFNAFPFNSQQLFESTAKPECNHNNCIWCLSLVKHDHLSDASATCIQLIYPYGLLGKSAAPVKRSVQFNLLSAQVAVSESLLLSACV